MEKRHSELESFGGTVGRVLPGAFSFEAMSTGLTIVGVMKGAEWLLTKLGQPGLIFHLGFIFFSILLTRFAMNGRAGEQRGLLLSTAGGSGSEMLLLTLRSFVLWGAIWAVPLEMLGLTPGRVTETVMMLGMGQIPGGTLGLTAIVVALLALCPPIFLIMAVGTGGLLEVFLPAKWGFRFRGRLSEVLLVYAVYLGGLGLIAAASAPIIFAVSTLNTLAGTILGWVAGVYAAGFAVDLLGRLCGFFVFTGGMEFDEPGTLPAHASPVKNEGPDLAPVVFLGSGGSASGALAPGSLESLGRPALEDARERLGDLMEWFGRDPDRALAELEDLRLQYAPDPLVMHSLCLLYDEAGRREESRAVAREALAVCLHRKATRLAAEVYARHLDTTEEFSLDLQTRLSLAESLHEHEDLVHADAAYRGLVREAPGDRKAVKGHLRVAESCLHRSTDVERAREIYSFLLESADQAPLLGFMRDGLAEAERRLAA